MRKKYYPSKAWCFVGTSIVAFTIFVFLNVSIGTYDYLIGIFMILVGLMEVLLGLGKIQKIEFDVNGLSFYHFNKSKQWRWVDVASIVEDSIFRIPIYHVYNEVGERIMLISYKKEMVNELLKHAKFANVNTNR